jgi:AcrR family transcriptional regulator
MLDRRGRRREQRFDSPHFGTKDELLRQTLDRMAAEIAVTAGRGTDSEKAVSDPRALSLILVAAGLGWLMFEPFLLRAALADESDASAAQRTAADFREAVRETALQLATMRDS